MRVIATSDSDYVSGRLPIEIREITAEECVSFKGSHRRIYFREASSVSCAYNCIVASPG
jgi:hypothetical protein